MTNINQALDQLAALKTRCEAMTTIKSHVQRYEYRLADSKSWRVVIVPNADDSLEDITKRLRGQFGERLQSVRRD